MRKITISAIVFLSVLVIVLIWYVLSGWLSLYEYGWGVMGVGGVLAALAVLLLLNIHSRTPWGRRQARNGLPARTWVDAVPAIVAGCVIAAAVGFLLIRASIALGLRPERGEGVPSVLSMQRELQPLWDRAYAWQDDAYLDEATIYLGEDSSQPWLLDAHFKSPSDDQYSLLLYVYPDGSIHRSTVDWSKVHQEDPIADSDWPLDSRAALEAFANNVEIGFCLRSSGTHSHRLTLERLGESNDAPVVWTLLLDACPGVPSNRYHVDAVTGDFIDTNPP